MACSCENLTEGSLSHGSQFLTEHLAEQVFFMPAAAGPEGIIKCTVMPPGMKLRFSQELLH